VYNGFTMVVLRIFNCDKTQDNILTLDTEQFDGSTFCVFVYKSYKLSKMYGFYWATLYIACICNIQNTRRILFRLIGHMLQQKKISFATTHFLEFSKVGWLVSTVGRTSVFGRQTDPVLSSACSQRVTTMWVNRPL